MFAGSILFKEKVIRIGKVVMDCLSRKGERAEAKEEKLRFFWGNKEEITG